MRNDHTGAIKGLAIANLIITGLSLLLVAGCTVWALANIDPLLQLAIEYSLDDYYDGLYSYSSFPAAGGLGALATSLFGTDASSWASGILAYGNDFSYSFNDGFLDDYISSYYAQLEAARNTLVGIITAVGVVGSILVFVTFLASIFCVANAKKPEKRKTVMVWGIVGAVFAFLSGSILVLVFFIIIAVFANSDKKLYAMEGGFGSPAVGGAPAPGAPVPPPPMGVPYGATVSGASVSAPAPAPVAPAAEPAPVDEPASTPAPIAQPEAVPQETMVEETVVETEEVVAEDAAPAADGANAPAPAESPKKDNGGVISQPFVIGASTTTITLEPSASADDANAPQG